MGAPIPHQESTEIPKELSYLHDTYKQAKFSRIPNPEFDPAENNPELIKPAFLLIPREMLNYQELESFNKLSGLDLEAWEIDAMLSIDSIFERSRGA